MKKYSDFKKMFEGDSKLNIVAVSALNDVLAHRAVVMESPVLDSGVLDKILKELKSELAKNGRDKLVHKYEVVFPTKNV